MATGQRFRYCNGTDHDLLVILEPWGRQFRIRPGQQVEVVIEGGEPGDCLEVEHTATGAILYGATGSTITLLSGGVELASEPQE